MLTESIQLPSEKEMKKYYTRSEMKQIDVVKDECIKKVLRQIVGHKVLTEELKQCRTIGREGINFEFLLFRGRRLGTLHRTLEGKEYHVQFKPDFQP